MNILKKYKIYPVPVPSAGGPGKSDNTEKRNLSATQRKKKSSVPRDTI
jgi:hypothetical protein